APARRDRPGADVRGQGADLRRALRDPLGRRARPRLRGDRGAAGRGARDPLHLAPAGRDLPAGRPRDRAQGRAGGDHAPGRRAHHRRADPADGRARHRRAAAAQAAVRARRARGSRAAAAGRQRARQLRAARGRGAGRRGPRRLRPLPARGRARRHPPRPRRRGAPEREADPPAQAARRRPRRHRRDPGGPQARGPDPRAVGPRERRPRLARRDLELRRRPRPGRAAAGGGSGEAVRDPPAGAGCGGAEPERRQPAEGGAEQVARAHAAARGRGPRRADARGRRRREVRDLPADRRARRGRRRSPADLLRAAGGDRHERPDPGDEQRPGRRNARAVRVQRGADPHARGSRLRPRPHGGGVVTVDTRALRVPAPRGARHADWLQRQSRVFVVWGLLAVLITIGSIMSGTFRSEPVLVETLKGATFLGMASAAQFFVVVGGGIDLSVAGVATISGMAAAVIMNGQDGNIAYALLATLGIGLAVGTINGLLVNVLNIAPFVATFGMFYILQGVGYTWSVSPIGQAAPSFYDLYV